MKEHQNKEWLNQKYTVEKLSTPAIAEICKCNPMTIRNWLKKHNIKIRSRSESQMGELSSVYRPVEERFWEKVDKNGPNCCWVWIAGCNNKGYGQIEINNKMTKAHIVSWELHNGRKVKNGHIIHHKCKNKKCCNPEHLQEITNSYHSKFHNLGEKCCFSKLKEWQVLEIRSKYATGKYTQKQLAKEYNVARTIINRIINRKIWTHI